MTEDYRYFEVADPFGATWQVKFLWQQNAISIRHADAVDVKFLLITGETRQEKVIAMAHADLLALSARTGRPVTDSWVSRLAALHLRRMIESWEDMEKSISGPSPAELEAYRSAIEERTPVVR